MLRMVALFALLLCASACVSVLPSPSVAADFDGSKPLVCTVITINECLEGEGCMAVAPEDVNLPRHLWVDAAKKTIQDKWRPREPKNAATPLTPKTAAMT